MSRAARIAIELARAHLAVRHDRSWIGVAWYVAGPVAMLAAVAALHSSVGAKAAPSLSSLAVGLLCFSYFRSMTTNVAAAPRNSAALLRGVSVPLSSVFASRAIESSVVHVVESIVVLVVVACTGGIPLAALGYMVTFVLLAVLALSIGVVLAVASSFAEDARNAWTYMLTVLMFVAPVFVEMDRATRMWIVELNPITHAIDAARAAFIEGRFDGVANAALAGFAVIFACVAYAVYRRFGGTLVERL